MVSALYLGLNLKLLVLWETMVVVEGPQLFQPIQEPIGIVLGEDAPLL